MLARKFEDTVMPHLDAAFNYARWLTKSDVDAEDLVQEACVRAMRFLSSLRDGNPRPWLFAIVRNTWYSRVSRRGSANEAAAVSGQDERPDEALDPEQQLVQQDTVARVLPFWNESMAPAIRAGRRLVVAAHGNSIRALVKYLDGISDDAIVGLNIPNGIPLVYELDDELRPLRHYYLGDADAAEKAVAAVASQGKA